MNAYAERFMRSIRQEARNHFIVFSGKQVKKIVCEYINYYKNTELILPFSGFL